VAIWHAFCGFLLTQLAGDGFSVEDEHLSPYKWRQRKRHGRKEKTKSYALQGRVFMLRDTAEVMKKPYRRAFIACRLCVVLSVFTLFSMLLSPAQAAESSMAVERGSFIYTQVAAAGQKAEKITYQVDPAEYKGVDAWRIAWDCERMSAVHYIRRGDGAPLYTRRINHVLQQTVEVSYSMDASTPHIYHRESRDETFIRRIHQNDLKDLGTLPQILSGLHAVGESGEFRFSAIDYQDGQVYELLAKRVGYTTVKSGGESVRCAVFEVNLDSWKAAFNPTVRLQIPLRAGRSNFASYSGPDPADSGKIVKLRLLSRSADVAALDRPSPTVVMP